MIGIVQRDKGFGVLGGSENLARILDADGGVSWRVKHQQRALEIGDLGLRGIALPVEAESKKTVTSFRIDAESLAVYMLGRPKASPDSRTVQIIGRVDVLLLDAARLEIDVKELSSLIGALDPSLVLANGIDPDTEEPSPMLKSLLGETGSDQANREPQPRVSVTKSNLPDDRQLVVLRPRS